MRVSIVINCCCEGLLLRRSLDSAIRSVEASGFAAECEIIAVADSANQTTKGVLASYQDRLDDALYVEFSDLGAARNAGVERSRGELVLFLDGDDLWCRTWVGAAWAEYLNAPGMAVLHPQYCVFFGARSELLVQPDWRDGYFDPRGLAARNHWISLCGAALELMREYPMPEVDVPHGFGFEDWSWYADAAARGLRHMVVPDTTHFIRLKAGYSMQKSMAECYRCPSVAFAEFMAADDPSRPHDL